MLNTPVWATFDTVTGRLQWHAGCSRRRHLCERHGTRDRRHEHRVAASLSPLRSAIPWQSEPPRSRWQPPTEYVDGLPLQDLAGFKIRYGTAADNLDQLVTIANPGITSAMIESLTAGTWYFAVNAYTLANVESNLSNVVQKTIL